MTRYPRMTRREIAAPTPLDQLHAGLKPLLTGF